MIMKDMETVKILDFGFSKRTETQGPAMSFCGTAGFIAPEIKNGKEYESTCDIYSLGIILLLLLLGKMPLSENANLDLQCEAGRFDGNLNLTSFAGAGAKLSKEVKRLILRLLDPVPERRLTIRDIFKDEWFQSCGCISMPDDPSTTEDILGM